MALCNKPPSPSAFPFPSSALILGARAHDQRWGEGTTQQVPNATNDQEPHALHLPQLPGTTVHKDYDRGVPGQPCMATMEKGQSHINPEPLGPGSWEGLATVCG